MKAELEDLLFDLIFRMKEKDIPCAAREAIKQMVDKLLIHEKQGYATLDKWEDKGYWDCGVSLGCGWFTDEWQTWEQMTGRQLFMNQKIGTATSGRG